MNLQIVLTYSRTACRYIATAYPTDEAAQEYGASVHEAVDLESATVSSCLRTLLSRRRQAGDQVTEVTFNPLACAEMEQWGLLDEWRSSLRSIGIRLTLQREEGAVAAHGEVTGLEAAEGAREAA